MNLWKALALAAVAATFSIGAHAQQTQQAPATTAAPTAAQPEAFKDWSLYCHPSKAAGEPQVCEIRTVVLSKEGKPLGALVVAAVPDEKTKQMQVIASALVPLGVDLMTDPALKVDDGKQMPLRYLRCLQRGCEAIAPLPADQQAAMRAGSKAKVAVAIGGGKNAVFDFSLSGFGAALDAANKRSGIK
ncbi:MAG TPA: invasion associated locus B family protein [Dongiaceae bacterium]|nr:invasion associated locus B family protein [Dongiaceae bacterium]